MQQSSPPGGFRKMLPNCSATLTMLSHGATTPPLCPSQFATSYRRPNFGHRTGSLRQIVASKSLPAPASCLYRSARRFYLPPSRIAGSDLPGRPDLAPGWYPGGRPAAAGGCTVLRTCAAMTQPGSTVLARQEVPTSRQPRKQPYFRFLCQA